MTQSSIASSLRTIASLLATIGIGTACVQIDASGDFTHLYDTNARLCDDHSPVGDIPSIVACGSFENLHEPKDLSGAPGIAATYRLFAGPSTQQPIVIRIDIGSNDKATLSMRTLERMRDTANRSDVRLRAERLDATELRRVLATIDRSTFWTLPAIATGPTSGVLPDGSEYVTVCADGVIATIEGMESDRYHVSSSGCVTMDGFVELAATIMDLARTKFDGLDSQWMVRFREYLH